MIVHLLSQSWGVHIYADYRVNIFIEGIGNIYITFHCFLNFEFTKTLFVCADFGSRETHQNCIYCHRRG